MSDTDDVYDNDGNLVTPKGDGPKGLRDALAAAQAERDLLRKENETFKAERKTMTIEQALTKHGAPPRLKRLVASELDEPSDDAVLEWLKTNGADFGWQEPVEETDDEKAARESAGRVSRAANNAPSNVDQSVTAEYLRTAPREELIRRGFLGANQT